MSDERRDAKFYCLDIGCLPDSLYKPDVAPADWQKFVKIAGCGGFEPGSLRSIAPISLFRWLERIVVFPIYMFMNAAPFLLPPLLYIAIGLRGTVIVAVSLVGVHLLFEVTNPMKTISKGQYIYTERNITKYNSIKFVWPKSMQPPNSPGPKIFCFVPHGFAPLGVVAYPAWKMLFGGHLCRWTCAPVVLKLPVISYFLKMVGYVPANSFEIKKVLERGENVGVILDGIAGMFQFDAHKELACVNDRKGIIKIALTTGASVVPVFGFGHSGLWRIIVDPFGLLQKLSIHLNLAIAPFLGRPCGLLPFGPPYRIPVLTAIGDVIPVPKLDEPTVEQINAYHSKLLEGFTQVFETHKAAYGWPHKKLEFN